MDGFGPGDRTWSIGRNSVCVRRSWNDWEGTLNSTMGQVSPLHLEVNEVPLYTHWIKIDRTKWQNILLYLSLFIYNIQESNRLMPKIAFSNNKNFQKIWWMSKQQVQFVFLLEECKLPKKSLKPEKKIRTKYSNHQIKVSNPLKITSTFYWPTLTHWKCH